MDRTDVVVAGAGPTGLFLAGELALRGVGVTVLERLAEPDPTIKAGSINVASAEILDRRGLLPAAEKVQRRFVEAAVSFAGRQAADVRERLAAQRFPVAGHFAGMMFRPDLVDQSDPVLTAHSAVSGGILVPQHDLELLLEKHCTTLGAEIRRGVAVRGVRITGDAGVVVETSDGDLAADWVVAADGGRSVLRKQLSIEFAGTGPQLVGYQAIADLDDVSGLRRGWTWTPRGIYAYGPIPGRIAVARFGPQPQDRDAPVSLDELQEVIRDVTGVPVTVKGLRGRATRWADNARQARTYRQGRVLFAGDAAHVHAPFSGQGLNLGLGDAVNLGWKLAATIQGWAPAGLLDTYETERHPIAAWVLDWTRAQVALMRGDEGTGRLRDIVSDQLLTVPGAMNRMVALTSGITQHYNVAGDASAAAGSVASATADGSVAAAAAGSVASAAAAVGSVASAAAVGSAASAAAGLVPSAAVGSIAGDVRLGIGGRIADHAHDGRFVLVDRSGDSRLAAEVDSFKDRIAYVADPAAGASLLMRPDGVIAWAGDPGDLEAAIQRWAGAR